jgi:hypothetical protein
MGWESDLNDLYQNVVNFVDHTTGQLGLPYFLCRARSHLVEARCKVVSATRCKRE